LGQLEQQMPRDIQISIEDNQALVTRPSDEKHHRALHGLTRSLLANMVEGVTKGYVRNLELVGVGYRAALQGKDLSLTVGYSHPVVIKAPQGIEFEVPAPNKISVKGIDKQAVGQIAAEIRAVRKPEPYLGKGIKYEGEQIRRKVGKAGK
jgi:large subunit ribosomal protein L6